MWVLYSIEERADARKKRWDFGLLIRFKPSASSSTVGEGWCRLASPLFDTRADLRLQIR
jgi:hypothetical protein